MAAHRLGSTDHDDSDVVALDAFARECFNGTLENGELRVGGFVGVVNEELLDTINAEEFAGGVFPFENAVGHENDGFAGLDGETEWFRGWKFLEYGERRSLGVDGVDVS